MARRGNDGSDTPQNRTRNAWFRAGHSIPSDDSHRGANEGLSRREIRALAEENSRPWGLNWFARDAVKARAEEAQSRARARGRGGRGGRGRGKK
jgi:hypothetical protein